MDVIMSEEQKKLQFTIDQLRKDKIIYAVDASALNLICLFVFFFTNQYFNGTLRTTIHVLDFIIAIGYTLFVIIGNTIRFLKIISLQKKL